MTRTILLLAASRLIHDGSDNRISAIDILEDFPIAAFPVVFPRTSILWMLERDQDDPALVDGTLTILLDNIQLQQFPVHFDFADQTKSRALTVITGMVLNGPGRVIFRARRNGQDQDDREYSFKVVATGPQAAGGPASILY
jgi:hypothetical protein